MADATFTAVDLSRLPAPDVIEKLHFETILAEAVAQMQARMPDFEARDSDPATKLLQVTAYLAQLLRQRVNDAARAVMPAYATGADLDNIAALFGIARLTLTPANTELGIPAVMESDADFRRRMVLAPEGYSVAGPEGAYIFHALSADPLVLDASATSPEPDDIRALVLSVLADHDANPALVNAMTLALDSATWPGQVVVSVLSRAETGEASPALIAIVEAHLSDETIRPLTDHVIAQSAEIVGFEVDATLTTFSGPDGAVVLDAARARLDRYVEESHRIGRDITISGLHAALHVEGVQNVVLAHPTADLIISRTQAPFCTGISLTYAGTGE
ncbi:MULTISPECIES: baseplate J/gp47 family protein [Sphingobium]|uniref:baseplate assembly protein n=1 Tax=Sphingobium TaxID=165695 RepID=UPI0015EC7414|nr:MULTISPECIES: baseplate J/gp47 family protein [Sphingobium]MCW2363540.1 phage-related baseplate assembly protein [Sphingobium sp. B10D3B]MCW2403061.1 phage-related baseplate assembly protein [Sphingobium sp. B10D7B]MCW2410040.1 phage-related baseplate assembly protein [Sphingobium xanthum]